MAGLRREGGSARWTSQQARPSWQEPSMAKGQKKSNKEVRKPKADKKPAATAASPFIVTSAKK
jgi:hypothetical protein